MDGIRAWQIQSKLGEPRTGAYPYRRCSCITFFRQAHTQRARLLCRCRLMYETTPRFGMGLTIIGKFTYRKKPHG